MARRALYGHDTVSLRSTCRSLTAMSMRRARQERVLDLYIRSIDHVYAGASPITFYRASCLFG